LWKRLRPPHTINPGLESVRRGASQGDEGDSQARKRPHYRNKKKAKAPDETEPGEVLIITYPPKARNLACAPRSR